MPDAMPKPPKLYRHATGQWCCKWGGRFHYFGTNKKIAKARYLESIKEWAAFKARPRARRSRRRIIDVAERFLDSKDAEGGRDVRGYYAKHLARFITTFADVSAGRIRPRELEHLKQSMLEAGYAPRTINHDLTAIKTMLRWAGSMDLIPPVSFGGVRSLPLGPPPDKSLPDEVVWSMIRASGDRLMPWLALNYLCLARPSEIVRLVHQQGRWVEPGVFRLDRGKIDKSARLPRHLVLSDSALTWLEHASPTWSRLDSYSQAVRRVCEYGPGVLRHSAATNLHRLGVAREDIDLLLGHAPPRVSLTYAPIVWQPLRQKAALLAQ